MEDNLERDSWSPTSENMFESQYPLHRACRDGDLEALSMLMSAGRSCDFYQEDGFYGWTPIHWAAHFGKFTCLMRLIEHGCNCDHSTERLYQTPLHLAAQNGKGHCLKWLLHCGAAINRQLACLRKLVIERSVGLDTITSKFSQTALHMCALSGQPHCLQWLIQSGANTYIQDYMGESPLHKCARTGNMECISLLISQGTKLNIKNHNGLLPNQLAAESGHQECGAYIERAMQLQEPQNMYESQTTLNPSSNLRHDQPITESVVTNGHTMEDDDDMETDLPIMPNVRNGVGMKRSREHCEEDECKKSRRDDDWDQENNFIHNRINVQQINGSAINGKEHLNNKPTSWDTFNGLLHTNGFAHNNAWTNQNGFIHQNAELNHHGSKYQNGFSPILNGNDHVKHLQNGSFPLTNGHTCYNNSISVSNSSVEHFTTVTQERGYDSLLLDSLDTGNQYDGS